MCQKYGNCNDISVQVLRQMQFKTNCNVSEQNDDKGFLEEHGRVITKQIHLFNIPRCKT